jgi:hypothetical protein
VKYRQTEKPPSAYAGTPSFAHEVQVIRPAKEYNDIVAFLIEHYGPKHGRWRISAAPNNSPGYWYGSNRDFVTNVRFRESGDAMLFKLSWR